jgi:hypothetical protein
MPCLTAAYMAAMMQQAHLLLLAKLTYTECLPHLRIHVSKVKRIRWQ